MLERKRAVAYCRVSSDHDDQINSLENQKQHWEEYIRSRADLEFVDIYVDEGVSGTQTKNRNGFNRMMRDAEHHKFDLVLTKEVSRFGRNIVDVLTHTRKLKELGIGVFFETQGVHTLDTKGEMWLGILATFAQEESRMTSERVKWGHNEAMKKGIVFGADRVLGYDRIGKSLFINEDEARIVRDIFQWYVDGESLHGIVRRLAEQGFTAGKLRGKISHDSIRRILKNEKYCGDLVQAKSRTVDFLTHKVADNPESKWVVLQDSHPAIVDKETWNKAQAILQERRERLSQNHIGYSRTIWSSKLYCAHCGKPLRKKTHRNKDGSDRPVWQCPVNHDKGSKGCTNGGYIREDLLKKVLVDVFQSLISDKSKERFVATLVSVVEKQLSSSDRAKEVEAVTRQLEQLLKKRERLLDLYVDGRSLSRETFDERNRKFNEQEAQLKNRLHSLEHQTSLLADKKARLSRLYEIIRQQAEVKVFDESLVTAYLERVTADMKEKRLVIALTMGQQEIDLTKYPKRMDNNDHPSR